MPNLNPKQIAAARYAVSSEPDVTGTSNSCFCCVIISGRDLRSISSVLSPEGDGRDLGTLFFKPNSDIFQKALGEYYPNGVDAEVDHSASSEGRGKAEAARVEARNLLALSYSERQAVLRG